MSKKENDDFVATKAEKTFDDDGNIQVADANLSSNYKGGLLYKGKAKDLSLIHISEPTRPY